jgi:membrane protease YdiL (CAAX protease family)
MRIVLLLCCLFCFSAHRVSAQTDSLPAKPEAGIGKQQTYRGLAAAAVVALEAYSIVSSNPIPTYGALHFLNRQWGTGAFFLASTVALQLGNRYCVQQLNNSAAITFNRTNNNAIYYSGRFGTEEQYQWRTYADASRQVLYYWRLLDAYAAYQHLHRRTQANNRVPLQYQSIASLTLAPFKPKYLKRAAVWAPILIAAAGTYFATSADRDLGSVSSFQMLGGTYSNGAGLAANTGADAGLYLFTAAGEEMFFRGIVQTELTERINPGVALAASSLLFSAYHLPNNGVVNALATLPIGFYLGYRFRRNGYDLGETICTHFWINLLSNLAGFIRDPRTGRLVYSVGWRV